MRATLADKPIENACSVYKTNHPALLLQPFLLVFRTAQIVTAHPSKRRERVPSGYSGFPAYSRMRIHTVTSVVGNDLP